LPKRVIDGEGLWRSDKIASVQPIAARAEYANILPLALANGSFECSAQRVWSLVYSFNRPDISLKAVETFLQAFERARLLFRWTEPDGKQWGYFVGIEKPGRLPGPSRKGKNEKVGAIPPEEGLRKFLESKNFPGFGFGSCSGTCSGKDGEPENCAPAVRAKPRPLPPAFTGSHLIVSQNQDAVLGAAFPWVDRPGEYRKADSWLEGHPHRRPKEVNRFLHNWFNRTSQSKGKSNGKDARETLAPNELSPTGEQKLAEYGVTR
jgi:hypothetical protein